MKINQIKEKAAAAGLKITVIPSMLSIFRPVRLLELNGQFCIIEALTEFHHRLESLNDKHNGLNFIIVASDIDTFIEKLSEATALIQNYKPKRIIP